MEEGNQMYKVICSTFNRNDKDVITVKRSKQEAELFLQEQGFVKMASEWYAYNTSGDVVYVAVISN